MNWFLCVLGLLGVATVVCLCLHQYQATEGVRGEETYVDYTALATGADAQDLDLLALASVGDGVVAKEEQTAEEEEESLYKAVAEEEEAVPTRKRTPPPAEEEAVSTRKRTSPPAEEEATRASPPSASSINTLDVIDDLGEDLDDNLAAASTATPAEEETIAQEENRKIAAATTAKRTPPVQAVLQVIDVPPPEEEESVRVTTEAEEDATSASAEKSVSYQDETYAYHPSPKDQIVKVDEPGYVYLPSRFWSVPQKRPPPCTPSTKPKVCPIFTDGVPEGALEWRSTVRERQLRAAVRPAHARHRRDPKLDYYYPGYYAKGDTYKHKCV